MKAKLILESGREIEMELTDEQTELVRKEAKWPQRGDWHFFLTAFGSVERGILSDSLIDKAALIIGNVFRTEQEAKNVARALKLIEAIRQDRLELNGDWVPNNDHNNWSIHYSPKDFVVLRSSELYADTFGFFQSRNDAKQVIEKHRSELLWYFTKFLPERG